MAQIRGADNSLRNGIAHSDGFVSIALRRFVSRGIASQPQIKKISHFD